MFHLWFSNLRAREVVDAHTFAGEAERKNKEKLSSYRKADDSYFMERKRIADSGIHVTRDHSTVRSVS
jgi:hypothetical protein